MGKRGLYPNLSTKSGSKKSKIYMNFLQYADGKMIFRQKKLKLIYDAKKYIF